jgi:hypothetical protein
VHGGRRDRSVYRSYRWLDHRPIQCIVTFRARRRRRSSVC